MRRMSAVAEFPRSTKAEVFALLAKGLKAGATVITPNRRLALALKQEFDDDQAGRGLAVWEAADILPFTAFVERAYEDALYSEHAAGPPILLAPAQEQALWENIIRGSEAGAPLLAVPETARLAREAWQLAHAWELAPQLRNFQLKEDGRAFQEWAQRYERDTRRGQLTDSARLADLVAGSWAHAEIKKPKCLFCYGFGIVTPQQAELLARIKAAGCDIAFARPPARNGSAQRVACADSRDEIRRAATWARARLEADGSARISIVVPELAKHRSAILRIFSSVMDSDYALPGVAKRVPPFNVSLGAALTSYPLVNTALLVLELVGREIEFERASRLMRSPFLAGSEIEMTHRARLDAGLRRRAEPVVTLDRLLMLFARDGAGCPILAQRFTALAEFRKARLFGARSPSVLAQAISEALALVGFPGERGLDSAEYQTLKKWHEVLAGFAALDRVVPRTGYAEAVSRLRRMAADTLFQPETPDVPIQILGVLEAAGMEFDQLWVMGLSDAAWPPSPRPNPFLPIELQRAAKMPQASAVESLEFARRLTGEWFTCADEVVLSCPQREDDREFKPSPLIISVPEQTLSLPEYAGYRDTIHRARKLDRSADSQAPLLDRMAALGGGTAMIKDHAACPFRAFARHRLGAEGLQTPHTGLDAMERGTLVHRVLAQVWAKLKTRSALDTINGADFEALLRQAAEDAVARIRRDRPTTLAGRFAEIEKQRLARLARAWLEYEKTRGGFTVVATEDKRHIEIGGLELNARLDRVDELESGERIVIDYKTSAPSAGAMLGERPDEPQLPLYLVAAEPAAAAVAFAQVKAGDMKFAALASDGNLLPGVKVFSESYYRGHYGSWQEVIDAWRADLARIAAGFAGGDARVDPKQYPQTCRYCDVKPFCRIHERLENALDGDAA
jgi:ATP-dependent helicase/nuclease subunit B